MPAFLVLSDLAQACRANIRHKKKSYEKKPTKNQGWPVSFMRFDSACAKPEAFDDVLAVRNTRPALFWEVRILTRRIAG